MVGKIIGWIVAFGCALLFYGIGAYAKKLDKPMWFWSGTEVDPATITNVKQYNAENSKMWKWYSLWYVAAGVAEIWSPIADAIILVLASTVGLAILIWKYKQIFEKYRKK